MNSVKRIMGLDFGSKTVGVAISDALGLTAQSLETVRRDSENKLRRTLARLEEIIREYNVELIVLGLPKNMDDSIGERAEKTLEFKVMLERRTGLEVVTWDERLTTVEARQLMSDAGVKGKDMDRYVDQIAAAIILKGYMDFTGGNKDERKN
ncbi:Holliday junction resolvase RuvX [Parasporobacterium paucivorans]|uniref:Putative pre-16S rRNA nuclease n=1 Tax=Parasporobacterium paucivorans DSM 15970 TaxID=1122934 RepID=A0A1M6C0X2_9FIRM|nr:Holliday junction resolvase RuvX [Parasporobacterium paucivorans]SHI54348.1 putative holliday junction resolvase [Parasporobacterium paucivorans DSM 15970]